MIYRVVAPNIDTARWASSIGLDPKKVAAEGLFIVRGVGKNWLVWKEFFFDSEGNKVLWLGKSLTKRRVTPVDSMPPFVVRF